LKPITFDVQKNREQQIIELRAMIAELEGDQVRSNDDGHQRGIIVSDNGNNSDFVGEDTTKARMERLEQGLQWLHGDPRLGREVGLFVHHMKQQQPDKRAFRTQSGKTRQVRFPMDEKDTEEKINNNAISHDSSGGITGSGSGSATVAGTGSRGVTTGTGTATGGVGAGSDTTIVLARKPSMTTKPGSAGRQRAIGLPSGDELSAAAAAVAHPHHRSADEMQKQRFERFNRNLGLYSDMSAAAHHGSSNAAGSGDIVVTSGNTDDDPSTRPYSSRFAVSSVGHVQSVNASREGMVDVAVAMVLEMKQALTTLPSSSTVVTARGTSSPPRTGSRQRGSSGTVLPPLTRPTTGERAALAASATTSANGHAVEYEIIHADEEYPSMPSFPMRVRPSSSIAGLRASTSAADLAAVSSTAISRQPSPPPRAQSPPRTGTATKSAREAARGGGHARGQSQPMGAATLTLAPQRNASPPPPRQLIISSSAPALPATTRTDDASAAMREWRSPDFEDNSNPSSPPIPSPKAGSERGSGDAPDSEAQPLTDAEIAAVAAAAVAATGGAPMTSAADDNNSNHHNEHKEQKELDANGGIPGESLSWVRVDSGPTSAWTSPRQSQLPPAHSPVLTVAPARAVGHKGILKGARRQAAAGGGGGVTSPKVQSPRSRQQAAQLAAAFSLEGHRKLAPLIAGQAQAARQLLGASASAPTLLRADQVASGELTASSFLPQRRAPVNRSFLQAQAAHRGGPRFNPNNLVTPVQASRAAPSFALQQQQNPGRVVYFTPQGTPVPQQGLSL
jgi:hypothetical protein